MLSKSQISLVNSLQQKKNRVELGLFVVEGLKSITEFLNSDYVIDTLYFTKDVAISLPKIPQNIKLFEVNEQELKKISTLKTPQGILALVIIPQQNSHNNLYNSAKVHLVLDGIQDPGNLGTIIRTANWFGYTHIFCSPNTVDVYNPKTVQAAMGALSQIKIIYTPLFALLSDARIPIYGALLNGENIYKTQWPSHAFVVFGNEGLGISPEILPLITKSITIPSLGNTESLNVAVSAAIFCAQIQSYLQK